jgi:hypothetical protein
MLSIGTGSPSYDPDFAAGAKDTNLLYSWSCFRKMSGSPCFNASLSDALGAWAQRPQLSLPAGYFAASTNDTFTFTVTISKDTRVSPPSASIGLRAIFVALPNIESSVAVPTQGSQFQKVCICTFIVCMVVLRASVKCTYRPSPCVPVL